MGRIVIIGLGPGSPRRLNVEGRLALLRGQPLFLQTARHPVARWLHKRKVSYHLIKSLGRRTHGAIVRQLAALARHHGAVYLAVPGYLLSGRALAQRLLRAAPGHGLKIKIISGIGPPVDGYSLDDLDEIMTRLRSRDGCPWDRKQTHHSLREYLIEEAYEVVEAIERGNDKLLREELGDLLLQVVFHSRIAQEEGRFDLNSVINEIAAKLVRRHPHVFGAKGAANISQAMTRWEEVKRREKGKRTLHEGLPALLGAHKLQLRAASAGFDWPQIDGALEKLKEEVAELEDAYSEAIPGKIEEEFGDLLFAAVNVARFLDVNPEMALGKALRKFASRFDHVLSRAAQGGKPVGSYTLEQLDRWWEEAKSKGKKS